MHRWLLIALFLLSGSHHLMSDDRHSRPDINQVLRAHDHEWLRLPAVVGVAVGLLPDGQTQCLKVLLAHPEPATERALPRLVGGYPVIIEVTGEIKPLR